MKRIAAAMALLFVVSTPGLGVAATLQGIDQDNLNLRSGPGTNYQVLGTLKPGQTAKVVDSQNGWYKVQTAAGLEAWAAGWVSRVNYEDEQAYAIVDTDALNFRKEANTAGPIITLIHQGDRVRLLEIAGDWWRVRLGDGREGWVNGAFMKRDTSTQTPPAQTPPPPAQTPTPPAQTPPPPTQQQTPPAPQVPATPPPAPAGTIPSLPILPPAPAGHGPGAKQVRAAAAGTVYEGRNAEAFDPVDKVKAGEQLKYLDAAEGWVKVQTPRGLQGWIIGSAVTVTEGKLTYELKEGAWSLGYTAATPAPAPAPAPVPAPAPAPSGHYMELRIVNDAGGTSLRQSPSDLGRVIATLPQGEVLGVQGLNMPWIQVATAAGQVGWVDVTATERYTGTMPAPAPSPAQPAPTTSAPAPAPAPAPGSAFKAKLTVVRSGVLQLEVTSDKPIGDPAVDGNTLRVPVLGADVTASYLPVGSAGAQELALTSAGLALTMANMPGLQVVEHTASHLVLQLRPTVSGVTVRTASDRTVYDFKVMGPMLPRTSVSGSDVVVEFPGATNSAAGALPGGLTLKSTDTGLQFALTTRKPYALKQTATGFELHVYEPGLAGKVILIDPGHGGSETGAYNSTTGVKEKDINLADALRLRAMLAAKGATVYMTRTADTRVAPASVLNDAADPLHADLEWRTRMADEVNVDLFFSIHHNCCSGSGTEVYYTSGTLNGERSYTLASLVGKTVANGLGQTNRGVFDDLMYVNRNTNAPGILLELAFMSHATEGKQVNQPAYQDQAAQLMVKALEQFYSLR